MDFASDVRRGSRHWAGIARVEGSRPSAATAASASKLADLLLEWTAWGLISFPVLKKAADAANSDGLRHPDILRLASLGGANWPGNMRRDLLMQQRKQLMPEP